MGNAQKSGEPLSKSWKQRINTLIKICHIYIKKKVKLNINFFQIEVGNVIVSITSKSIAQLCVHISIRIHSPAK